MLSAKSLNQKIKSKFADILENSVKNHTIHNYNALKICLWHNFEMAEITITPVQATQAKSVII